MPSPPHINSSPFLHQHFYREIAVRGKQISGTRIIDAVRLEAAGRKGHILIDEATYGELPDEFQHRYSGPETVADKQSNTYRVYRLAVLDIRGLNDSGRPVAARRPTEANCPRPVSRGHLFHRQIRTAELMGREAEMKILNDAWAVATVLRPVTTTKRSEENPRFGVR